MEINPPWLAYAKGMLGVKEIIGPEEHHALQAMATVLGVINFQDDRDPWCSMFVSFCLTMGVPGIELPSHPKWSRAYQKWGIPLAEPIPGAIVVLWRGKAPEQDIGHVFFFTHKSPHSDSVWFGIGGNDQNEVRHAPYTTKKLLRVCWPKEYPLPEGAQLADESSDSNTANFDRRNTDVPK